MALSKFLSVFLPASFFFGLGVAQNIAAWHNGLAPQVLVQDPQTGDVYYSNCNSQNTPIFPTSPKNVFPFTQQPKVGSSLAGIGYNYGTTIVAGIWYTDDLDRIWQVLAQCDTSESNFTVTGTYLTSPNITTGMSCRLPYTGISNSTGLAALLLSSSEGYRVFYHNTTGYLHQYTYQAAIGWTDGIPLSPDLPHGFSISAAAKDSGNYSVIMPLNDEAIEAAIYRVNNTFNISTFPYPLTDLAATSDGTQANTVNTSVAIGDNSLPYWSSEHAHLGISADSSDQSRHIFYIDTTGKLQQYNCNSATSCALLRPQDPNIWPAADQPNAPFGIANAVDVTEIFYYSNGSLVVVELDSGNWQPASVLPTAATKSAGPTATKSTATAATSAAESSPSATSAIPSSQPSNGLSAGDKAGIAVGVVGGVALVAGLIFFWTRKRQGANELADTQLSRGWFFRDTKPAWVPPIEVADTQRHEMDGKMRNELDQQASVRREMEQMSVRHEMG